MGRLTRFWKWIKSFGRPRPPSVVAQSSTSSALNSIALDVLASASTPSPMPPTVSTPVSTATLPSIPALAPAPVPAPISTLASTILSQQVPTHIPSPRLPPTALPPPKLALTGIPAPLTANTRTLCLWGQALEKLRNKGLEEFGSGDCDIQLVQKLIAKVESTKAECNSKRFSYNNSRGEEVFYVEKFLTKLKKFAFIGDIAIQQNPDIVALAWAGFRLLLEVGIAYTENMEMISDSLEYLVSVIFCGEIYERLYSSTGLATAEPLNRSLVDLYAVILEYLWCAEKFLSKKTAIRTLESFFSPLKRILESVQKLETVTRSNADLAEKEAASNNRSGQGHLKVLLDEMQRTVIESYRTIEDMWKYIEKKQRLKVLRWISDVEFGSHHSEFRNRRHADTGNWLLQNPKFNDWITSSLSRIFWLRGDAGSGKTMLASKVIDVLQDKAKANHHALAYFYCYFQESARSDPKSILRAIVKQLCVAHSESLPESVMSIYEDRERWGHSTGPLDLIESRNIIIELLRKFSHTTIAIDALDECNPKTRGEMFQILKQMVESGNNVQIFVTSRNEGDIREMLFSMPNHYIDARDNSEDINKYIRTEVARLCNERSLLRVDQALKKEIITALEDGAKGMFLWAHLQILAIRDENTPGDIRAALRNLPEDLNATYLNILQRVQKQSKTSHRRAVKVLKWVLCAQGVCSPETIRQALLFDSTTPLDSITSLNLDRLMDLPHILDICRNFVIYDKELRVLRFAHFSVEEFLRVQPEYSPEEIHTSIAEICLTVLCPNPNLKAQIKLVPGLLDYATFNWAVHTRLSIAGGNTLQHLWRKFLQPSSVHYIAWTKRFTQTGGNYALRAQEADIISPLWIACFLQLYVILDSLLNDGVAPDSYNESRQTPLSYVSKHGYEIFVKRLLEEEGVDVNNKDEFGQTPLYCAAKEGHEKVVQMLLEKEGIDVNTRDTSGRTPLLWAAAEGHDKVVRALLEKKGVDMSSKDEYGETPLSRAVEMGHDKVVRVLLKKDGVNANSENIHGQTPLFCATKKGYEKVVQALLEKEGVDPNSKDKPGRTPLSWAAGEGHDKVVWTLLKKEGVNVNTKDIFSRTPLSWAAEKGHEKVVQMLLGNRRVKLNIKDESGETPLSWATRKGHRRVAQMLRDAGNR